MHGRRRPVIHTAELVKNPFQPVFQARLFRNGCKVVSADMAAVLAAEGGGDHLGKGSQHLIAHGEAVLCIEKPHAAEIYIKQHRQTAVLEDGLFSRLSQFKEIRHGRQAGQIIVFAVAEHALLAQHVAQRSGESVVLLCRALCVAAFVHIPHLGKANAVLGVYMFSLCVNDKVIGCPLLPRPVDHVIFAALRCKTGRCIRDPGDIVGMGVPVHVVVHVMVGLLPVFIAQQLAESVRKGEGDHPLVDELVNGKRRLQALQHRFFLLREYIPIHKTTLV